MEVVKVGRPKSRMLTSNLVDIMLLPYNPIAALKGPQGRTVPIGRRHGGQSMDIVIVIMLELR